MPTPTTSTPAPKTIDITLAEACMAYNVSLATIPHKYLIEVGDTHINLRDMLCQWIARRTRRDELEAAAFVDEYLEESGDWVSLTDLAGWLPAVVDQIRDEY